MSPLLYSGSSEKSPFVHVNLEVCQTLYQAFEAGREKSPVMQVGTGNIWLGRVQLQGEGYHDILGGTYGTGTNKYQDTCVLGYMGNMTYRYTL